MYAQNLYRGLGLAAAAVLGTLGLACDGDAGVTPPDENAAAGRVVDVSGQVTVEAAPGRRDSAASLARGDEVTGADVIVTGADGSVAVQLYHNHRVWNLGADKRARVADSWAWTASRVEASSGGDLPEPDRTATAGRQSERQVASTRTTALSPKGENRGGAAPDRAPTRKPVAVETAGRTQERAGRDRKPRRDLPAAPAGASPEPAGAPLEPGGAPAEPVSAGAAPEGALEGARAPLQGDTATPARNHARKPMPDGLVERALSDPLELDEGDDAKPLPPPPVELGATRLGGEAGKIDRKAVAGAMAARLAALTRCLGKGPAKRASVILVLAVARNGRVRRVKLREGSGTFARCATKTYADLDFGDLGAQGRFTVTQTLIWNGAAR